MCPLEEFRRELVH
jgi:hypothetical protein